MASSVLADPPAAPWRLLGRPGCHLCDEFADELLTAFPGFAARLEWVEVDSREDWRARFGLSIPVLLDPDGSPVCETFFDRAAVAAVLGRYRDAGVRP